MKLRRSALRADAGALLVHSRLRRLTRVALTLALTSAPFVSASGQRLQFRHLTPDQGLASSWVESIIQDSHGFMWFGTAKGLNRYDGHTFTVYRNKVDDSTSLKNARINALFEDRAKQLWLGSTAGVSRYDRERDAFDHYTTPNDSILVGAIAEAGDRLWIGTTRGLFQLDRTTRKITRYGGASFVGRDIVALHADRRNHLWVGTTANGAYEIDITSGSTRNWTNDPANANSIPGNNIRAILEDPNGGIWLGTYEAGLALLDRTTGSVTRYQHDPANPNSLGINSVRKLAPAGNRGIWVGMENAGVDYFDLATRRFHHNRFDPNNPSALNNNSVWAVYPDRTGMLWVGTFAGGVNVAKQNGEAIRRYRTVPGDASSLSFNSVIKFHEDARGYVWVATDGGGLNRLDRATGRFTRFTTQNSNLNSDAVLAIAEDRSGKIWVGSWAGGISRLDQETGRFTSYTTKNSGISSDNIFALYGDKAGNLWIGTWNLGLQKLDPSGKFTTYPIVTGNQSQIRTIAEASDGNLLIGAEGGGLIVFDPRTERKVAFRMGKDGLSDNQVHAVLETEPGIVWVGTSTGLDRVDRRTNTVTHFTEADGLASPFVAGLATDGARNLWVAGDRGITRFDPFKKKGKIFTVADGLQGSEFNPGAYHKTRDGMIFLGGSQGFNTLRPDSILENRNIPPVAITGFQLFNKPVVIGGKDSPLETNITVAKEIDLNHKQSVFTIEFAALDFAAPEKNRYSYKLEGLDKEWNDVGTKRSASYTNLPAGKYVFRVKGSNNDEIWNTEGASLAIRMRPPFWASWWFRLLVLIVVGAAVRHQVLAARARRKNLEQMNATLAEAAERDRRSQQYLERNVLEVLGAMERFSEGDLSVALPVEKDDAIGKLRGGFNVAVVNIHGMVKQVRDVLDATVHTSRQIHSQTVELTRGAEEQLEQSLLVASAAKQMAETVSGSATNISEASEMAQRSGTEAHEGGRVVRDTFTGMDEIVSTVETSAQTVEALGRSSEQIGAITRVIEQIADQTELLSLNAAIEAARAGKHGRTFAVVAQEVQRLAERTATATSQISKVIEHNQREVESAVTAMAKVGGQVERGRQLVDKAGSALDAIIANAERMLACIQQVRASSEEQSATTAHISENIETISRVTHSAVSGNQTIAASVEELNRLIEDLQTRVARFTLESETPPVVDPKRGVPELLMAQRELANSGV